MKTNIVLFSRTVSAMIVAAMAINTIEAQTMSLFRQFTTPGMDRAIAVAADASGIYVIGNRLAPGGLNSADVQKYDSRGNELWTREFSMPTGARMTLSAVVADATGFYVLGLDVITINQGVLRKYSASGGEVWTRQLEFAPRGLTVDATGVYVAGRDLPPAPSYLRKYNTDGAELWTSRFGDRNNHYGPQDVAVDATGVYMFGIKITFEGGPGMPSSFVRKWDLRGTELWTHQSPAAFVSVAAAVPTGFYSAGSDASGFLLRRYDSDGNLMWTRRVAESSLFSPNGIGARGSGVVADITGVYVVGTSLAAPALPGQCRSGSGGDFFVRKYDPDGAAVWTREFGTVDAAWASGVAVDPSGVYVVGQEGTAMVRDDWDLFDVFSTASPTSGAFLAKFEKTAAVVTGSGPRIFPDCVVNAASYVGGGVAPGEIVTLFGSAMGPAELVRLRLTEDRRLATTLAETHILFDGVPAPLMYVSEKQSSAIVPYAVSGRTSVEVQVEYKGVRSEAVTVPVLPSRPGIFSMDGTGEGQGAILNEDGSVNSPSNPARRGSIITLYGTGGGEAAPGVVDGQIVSGVPPLTSLPVSVFFDFRYFGGGSKAGEVLYAGGVSGSVAGLLQVNVRVPANTEDTGNEVPFVLIIGSHWTVFQVTVALR